MDVVTRHQYGISAPGFHTPFRWETSGGVPKCRPFFQTKSYSNFFEYEQNEKNTVTYQCDVELQRMKKESEELSKDLANERKAHDTLRSVPRKPFKKTPLLGEGGGGGGTVQSFIRVISSPRSNPLPFYMPFLTEKEPLSYTFH